MTGRSPASKGSRATCRKVPAGPSRCVKDCAGDVRWQVPQTGLVGCVSETPWPFRVHGSSEADWQSRSTKNGTESIRSKSISKPERKRIRSEKPYGLWSNHHVKRMKIMAETLQGLVHVSVRRVFLVASDRSVRRYGAPFSPFFSSHRSVRVAMPCSVRSDSPASLSTLICPSSRCQAHAGPVRPRREQTRSRGRNSRSPWRRMESDVWRKCTSPFFRTSSDSVRWGHWVQEKGRSHMESRVCLNTISSSCVPMSTRSHRLFCNSFSGRHLDWLACMCSEIL